MFKGMAWCLTYCFDFAWEGGGVACFELLVALWEIGVGMCCAVIISRVGICCLSLVATKAWHKFAANNLDPRRFGWNPSGWKRSAQFQKTLKLSTNLSPCTWQAFASHELKLRSRLKASCPLRKHAIGPLMDTCWYLFSVFIRWVKSCFSVSVPVFFRRMSNDPEWMTIFVLLGLVLRIDGSNSNSSLTDVLPRHRFSAFASFTCFVMESPINI